MQLASRSTVATCASRRAASTVTEFDRRRLESLIEVMRERTALDHPRLIALEEQLGRAEVLPSPEVPPDVITMNSSIEVLDLDTGMLQTLTLVFPHVGECDPDHISVLSPLGLALLGAREHDELELTSTLKRRHLRVKKVLFQPEAAGNFSL
jgi:regulator of nucleoside diphosphate kinase